MQIKHNKTVKLSIKQRYIERDTERQTKKTDKLDKETD